MRNVTLRQLRILSAVTKTVSMAGAARQLHVTPPAITVQMQQLEETAGLPLVERLGEGTLPTPACGIPSRTAHKIEAMLAECEQEIQQLKGIKVDRLRCGPGLQVAFVKGGGTLPCAFRSIFRKQVFQIRRGEAVGFTLRI